jgi:dihydrofolate synthase/folylpolyglutamate synthase
VSTGRSDLLALEGVGIKLGLEQIRQLLASLGHPERAYPSLTVAGTNGKGSVTAMAERALRAAGYRTGRFTSPHLVHLEERFAIDGQSLAPERLEDLASAVLRAARKLEAPPSFFEATTALALEAFREAEVDVAVLEVGLGGRLDATNAVDAQAVAITAIDFDHQTYLGHTIEEIAREKAGIIKSGALAVLGENPARVCQVIVDLATSVGGRLVYAPAGVEVAADMISGQIVATVRTPVRTYAGVAFGLRGRHQIANAVTAIRLLEELAESRAFELSEEDIRMGVEQVSWPARLEMMNGPDGAVLLDGAHNPAGARALTSYVLEAFGSAKPMVVGAMRDKDLEGMLGALVPAAAHIICTAPQSSRAASAEALAEVTRRIAPWMPVDAVTPPAAALKAAARFGSPVVVAGSLYLAGEIRAELT